jgi:RND family efflux transporter MFP subunit
MNFFRTKKFYIGGPIVAIFLLFQIFGGSGGDAKFVTYEVQKGEVEAVTSLTGSVEADSIINLNFAQSGQVKVLEVKVGDYVEKGQLLAGLDSDLSQADLDNSLAGISLAQAELNLLLAGATEEEILISQTQIQEAQVNLDNLKNQLENQKLANDQSLKLAEFDLRTAEISFEDSELAENEKTSSSENTIDVANEQVNASLFVAQTDISSAISEIQSALVSSDKIVGVDNLQSNDDIEPELKRYFPILYPLARDQHKDIADKLDTLESNYYTAEGADLIKVALDEAVDLVKFTEQLLVSAETLSRQLGQKSTSISSTVTDALRTEVVTRKSGLTTILAKLQATKQALITAELNLDGSNLTANSSVNTNENALNKAKQALEQTKLSNKIAIDNLEMQIKTAEVALQRAEANHQDLISRPRNEEVRTREARIAQANASYNRTLAQFEDRSIVAPIDGVVTEVNIDVGENISSAQTAIVLISKDLQIIANVAETDIANVRVGSATEIDFDAFGPDKKFTGEVVNIDPAETVIQGVIYYKTTISFENSDLDNQVKSGMTANLEILSEKRSDVLVIPIEAVRYNEIDPYVFLEDEEGKRDPTDVKIGLEGNDFIEVLTGVKEGDVLILYEQQE